MFRAHIEARIEAAHRNGPPGHKCAGTNLGVPLDVKTIIRRAEAAGLLVSADGLIGDLQGLFDFHGHSWLVEIDWQYETDQLDANGWGPVDFGAAKDLIRAFDHHNMNLLSVIPPSAENLARQLYEGFTSAFGLTPLLVRVHEGHGNTMTYTEPEND